MTMIEKPSKYISYEYFKSPHNFCPGCGEALALRYFFRAVGNRLVFVTMPGCTSPGGVRVLDPEGRTIDNAGSLFGSTAAISGGIKAGLIAQGDTETLVVAWAGDGATFDIGLGGVSGAAERNDDILYVCYDNEGYQNTGNQRSSASPWKTTNTTNPPGAPKMESKKDIMAILSAHAIPYAATATVAFPDDLMRKVEKAKSLRGFRFLHILSPCPTGWGSPAHLTIELSRLAVDTKVFPLFEVEEGVNFTINRQPEGVPISQYTKVQRRFSSFTAEELREFERSIEQTWQRLQFLASYKIKIE